MNKLPETIEKYLKAANNHDTEQMIACFAGDASVHDVGEDRELKGVASIQAWLVEIHEKYRLQTRPLEITASHDGAEILAEVSGTFDGSPLKFRYVFKLRAGLIMFLSTTYIG